MPSHAHTKGTLRITGVAKLNCPASSLGSTSFGSSDGNGSGALRSYIAQKHNVYSYGNGIYYGGDVHMDTNWGGWSGETSYVGSGIAQNNMQPYLAVYMWRRTA